MPLPHFYNIDYRKQIEAEAKVCRIYEEFFDDVIKKYDIHMMNDWGEIFMSRNDEDRTRMKIGHDYVDGEMFFYMRMGKDVKTDENECGWKYESEIELINVTHTKIIETLEKIYGK